MKWVARLVRRIERRATRRIRFAGAVRALRTRMARLSENRWEMSDLEHAEFMKQHAAAFRDYSRLQRLGARWGFELP